MYLYLVPQNNSAVDLKNKNKIKNCVKVSNTSIVCSNYMFIFQRKIGDTMEIFLLCVKYFYLHCVVTVLLFSVSGLIHWSVVSIRGQTRWSVALHGKSAVQEPVNSVHCPVHCCLVQYLSVLYSVQCSVCNSSLQ